MAAPRPSSYADRSPELAAPAAPAPAPAPVPVPVPVPVPLHRAEVVESGSFARAVCTTCDWRGPGRRARAFAVTDVEEHLLLGGAPVTVDLRDRS
jgi:hypothetical protein